jgi:hypothetical protein
MHTTRRARRSLGRFNVVLATDDPVAAVVLHSAPTADEATIAFHQERQRLIQDVVRGELLVVHHHDETRMLLREPLSTDGALRVPSRPHRWG